MQGQDIALLLKLAIQNEPRVPSKILAESLFISPSEVSKALKRCADSGLLHISNGEKRVNRSALMEFLSHGLKYAFPPARGSMVRGLPTAAAAEPLKSHFLEDSDPPASVAVCRRRISRDFAPTSLQRSAQGRTARSEVLWCPRAVRCNSQWKNPRTEACSRTSRKGDQCLTRICRCWKMRCTNSPLFWMRLFSLAASPWDC